MALPALSVLVTGLEARLGLPAGSLDGVDLVRAQEVLSDAGILVTSELGGTLPAILPATVPTVLYAAAKRAYLNLADVQMETIGSYQVTYGDYGVGLTYKECAILARSKSTGGLWTQATTRDGSDVPVLPNAFEINLPTLDDSWLLT